MNTPDHPGLAPVTLPRPHWRDVPPPIQRYPLTWEQWLNRLSEYADSLTLSRHADTVRECYWRGDIAPETCAAHLLAFRDASRVALDVPAFLHFAPPVA